MKKSRLILTASVLALMTLGLTTGCSTDVGNSPENPAKVSTDKEESQSSGFTIQYVEIDGETVKCLFYKKGSTIGSMSCDWGQAVPK